ncbi:YhcN/YlaJ family sporulation lipoprotein [Paenibacillus sedimenti]|uniref:YhcN/YlaJ family sporulation lipoprotein n=1 Tax=Paenibacillus sedimenti TaxID=2770274 RepID=UPI001CB6EA55|nr:YhcN/YlaJ family sporulation lipoprotein [Paenibacillus sedimenti]
MNKLMIQMALIAGLIFTMTACAQLNRTKAEVRPNQSNVDAGSWDADSRNNENASIGAKSLFQSPKPTMVPATLDNSKAHNNSNLSMNRDLADRIVQAAHVGSSAVAVTDHNIYVAVDLGGMQAMGMNKHEQELSKNNDPESEAGLFGTGDGAQMDWISSRPLPSETANAIRRTLARVYPDANIFISANPHFVNRMLFYDGQQRKNKMMDTYLNEFNTMIQYAFPNYSTGQNNLMTK